MIEFRNITLGFGKDTIFANLSFKANAGDKVVITGKSGSGKSSLLSLLLGFKRPECGKVFFEGEEIDARNVWKIRRKIAWVDQETGLGRGRVFEKLEFLRKLGSNAHLTFDEIEIEKLGNHFELPSGVMQKNIGDLSGGERQRLSIVFAILLQRSVFLLDEPTAALNENLKRKVAGYFAEKELATCLVISHDSVWLKHPAFTVFDLEERKWKP